MTPAKARSQQAKSQQGDEPWPLLGAADGSHAQLSEVVATRLREQIISGKLKQGEFLRIDAVAKALSVSMTPVREGLLMLQSEAFVRLIPRRGFVVNSFSKRDVLDLFWAQATIGAELASRAAARMSESEIQRLEHLNTVYEEAIHTGDRNRDRLGHEFHRAINLAAESPRLALLLGGLTRQLPNQFYASIEGQLNSAAEYHPLILKAIKLRDAHAAGSLMHRHIVSGGEHLVHMLERRGMWANSPSLETDGEAAASQKKIKRRPRAKGVSSNR